MSDGSAHLCQTTRYTGPNGVLLRKHPALRLAYTAYLTKPCSLQKEAAGQVRPAAYFKQITPEEHVAALEWAARLLRFSYCAVGVRHSFTESVLLPGLNAASPASSPTSVAVTVSE